MRFKNRQEAGAMLGAALLKMSEPNPVVLALPRGGVPIGLEVAKALGAPLDLLIVHKIGHPLQPEYAVGAVAEDGHVFVEDFERELLDPGWLAAEVDRQCSEIRRRLKLYFQGRPRAELSGKTAILVDDGIATGFTMRAAVYSARRRGASKVIVAAPVASSTIADRFESGVDEIVILYSPPEFRSIGGYYDDFCQVTDEEVVVMLREAEKYKVEIDRRACESN